MTQTRSILLIAWLFVAGWLWLQWSEWNAAPATPATTIPDTTPDAVSAPPPAALPATDTASPAAVAALPSAPALPGAPVDTPATAAAAPVVRLRNDVLELEIDGRGVVVGSRLLGYREEKREDSPQVRLLEVTPGKRFTAESGLIAVDAANAQRVLPVAFRPSAGGTEFNLAAGASELRVPLAWTDPASGLSVQRTLVLPRGSYLLTIEDAIANAGTGAQRVFPFVELARNAPPPPSKTAGLTNPETFSFIGAAWYTPEEKFNKTPFTDYTDEAPPVGDFAGGWIGMLQHHFLAAWVPAAGEKQRFSLANDNVDGVPVYRIRSVGWPLDVAPGARTEHNTRLWVGPKLQKPLEAIAPGLKYSLDYGMFTFIAQPLYDYVLKPLHFVTKNWGWAIILTVLLLKLALYPLSAAQFRSMAKLRAVQPRIDALKERHGEDRQAFQMAMMDLYKKEKINPIGGCLPLLIPLPIFFALYWVLLETVELRHAPWIGWIQNLTAPDPYFILPALNLGVMYLTQKMTPTPGMDPMQKKMMQFMPLVFGVMMAFFPAGLVLYWVSNGLLGLLQQWWITKQHAAKPASAR
jgi:YidC/Oxa1 family membrane protein insertase